MGTPRYDLRPCAAPPVPCCAGRPDRHTAMACGGRAGRCRPVRPWAALSDGDGAADADVGAGGRRHDAASGGAVEAVDQRAHGPRDDRHHDAEDGAQRGADDLRAQPRVGGAGARGQWVVIMGARLHKTSLARACCRRACGRRVWVLPALPPSSGGSGGALRSARGGAVAPSRGRGSGGCRAGVAESVGGRGVRAPPHR